MNIPLVLLGFSREFESMVSSRRFVEFSIAGRDLHVAHALLALDVATPVELALAPEDEGGDDNGGGYDDDFVFSFNWVVMTMVMMFWLPIAY